MIFPVNASINVPKVEQGLNISADTVKRLFEDVDKSRRRNKEATGSL